MSMKKILIYSYILLGIGIIALAGLSVLLHQNQIQLDQKQAQQRQSYLLADELRQSSDDLTRFARTYVLTQDPKYEQMYWDVLAIRKGNKPRPQDYHRIYWDFVLKLGDTPRPETQSIALEQLMLEEGFSTAEFNKLHEAQKNSDNLVKTETIAMNAIKGLYDNGQGVYDKKAEPNSKLAIDLMHGEAYHRYKKDIMQPLDEFFQLFEKRTADEVAFYKHRAEQLMFITQVLVFSLLLVLITLAFFVIRYILREIGGEPREIAAIANKLAQGQLDIASNTNQHHSGVYAEIYQMSQTFKVLLTDTRDNLSRLAEGEHRLSFQRDFVGEFALIKTSLENTAGKLASATNENAYQNWLKTGQAELHEHLRGEKNIQVLAEEVINFLTPYLGAQVGAFYLFEAATTEQNKHPDRVRMIASHAYSHRKQEKYCFELGEGLVGQAAYERKLFIVPATDPGFMQINSGLGSSQQVSLLLAPFIYENQLKGVIEIASFDPFDAKKQAFIEQAMSSVAIAVHTSNAREEMQYLLEQSQQQAEELEVNQEELQVINNTLEERGKELEKQRYSVELQNKELAKAQTEIEAKASELSEANRYKSEFLANMSHELRTPLNSLLILSNLLIKNKQGNLEQEQVEYAETIHHAGQELLQLINDILDLSKVEAGKIELNAEPIGIKSMTDALRRKFTPIAEEKGVRFDMLIETDFPEAISTDVQRLRQILNNLLSNALKFTSEGQVKLHLHRQAEQLHFSVSDTGIGIAADKQHLIFNAFQQADGTTSRRYGGTGLGLSISKQLAQLMGGDILLESKEGQGSCFTYYLPQNVQSQMKTPVAPPKSKPKASAVVKDKILLLARNQQLIDNALPLLQKRGFDCIVTDDAPSVFGLTKGLKPKGLIFSDCLSTDLNDIPPQLQSNQLTAELPCLFLHGQYARSHGQKIQHLNALSALELEGKPLLILTKDEEFEQLLPNIELDWQQYHPESNFKLHKQQSVLIDLSSIDMDDLLAEQPKRAWCQVAVLFYAGEQSHISNQAYETYMDYCWQAQAQALSEFVTQLHPQDFEIKTHRHQHDKQAIFQDKTLLIVDDDTRNSYALKSAFANKGMEILIANNGQEALEQLENNAHIDLVLMDIMMPIMNGYQAMQLMRQQARWQDLPIIALTAKAMREDKQKCIDAGANDYLPKPVDIDTLLNMMRIHLYPRLG